MTTKNFSDPTPQGEFVSTVPRRRMTKGGRNNYLLRHAGSFRQQGCDEQTIFDLIWKVNLDDCKPPLETTEVAGIVRKLVNRTSGKPLAGTG